MPKRKRQPVIPAARPAPRRASPRVDAERRNQVLLVGVAIGIVVIALGIALFGYYQTSIAPKGEPVLKVEDRSFSLRYFERRSRYEVRSGNSALLSAAATAPQALVSMVQREEMIRRGAAEQAIAVTDEDIDAEIRRRLNVAPDVDRNAFAAVYRTAVHDSALSTSDFRELVGTRLLENQLRQKFESEVPPKTEQVHYRVILVATPEEGQTVLDRLNAGEDFAALATELSLDAASKDQGGDKPWTPRGFLDLAVEDVLFGLEPGQLSGVIETSEGAVIVDLLERQADRDTDAEQRAQLGDRAFEDWLTQLREQAETVTYLDEGQVNAILKVLIEEAGQGA